MNKVQQAIAALALPDFAPGSVWLVGAGPGDPGLISLLALHALAHADVVVHDALVDGRVLELANKQAAIEFAGKRGGKPSPTQPAISSRLVQLARESKRVLRLKGGDPFVFGRGGEEALALARAGVPFRIVPGVTSGIGGLAYAGIPVTHRDTNEAVTFITGHSTTGEIPDRIDWMALAKGSPVIVMYMALKHLGLIRDRLIAAGRKPTEPLAVVSEAATPRQRVVVTTLEGAVDAVAAAGIEPPAIIVLGEVVRLRAGLDWLTEGKILDPDPLRLGRDRDAG